MSSNPLGVGIDFGGTFVKVGVVDGDHVIAQAPPLATPEFDGAPPLIDAIAATISCLREKHPAIAAIGVGMPGFVDFEHGLVHGLTNVPGWEDIALRDELQQRCNLPTQVENDANAMAYAEWKLGAAVGCHHVIALTLGTGVGGGLIVNDRLVRGARSAAGELGQTSIDYRGRKGAYGNLGALENYIGNNEIAAEAQQAYAKLGEHHSIEDCQPAMLSKAAANGDPVALSIWRGFAEKLSCALLNCCYLLNPEIIVIGGGVAKAGAVLFGPLESHLRDQLGDVFNKHLRIVPARFGNEAGMLGSARIALEEAGLI